MSKIFRHSSLEIDFNNLPLNTYIPGSISMFWDNVTQGKNAQVFPLQTGPILTYNAASNVYTLEYGQRGAYTRGLVVEVSGTTMQYLGEMIQDLCAPAEGAAKIIVVTGPTRTGKTTFIQKTWTTGYKLKTVVVPYNADVPWTNIGTIYLSTDTIPYRLQETHFPRDSIIILDNMWSYMKNNEGWQAWLRLTMKRQVVIIFEEQRADTDLLKIATETYNGPFCVTP